MIFSASTDPSALGSLNSAPAFIFIIVTLAGVCIFLYRELRKEQTSHSDDLKQQLVEAKETRDKITEPLEKVAKTSEQMYELLVNLSTTKRRG